MAITGRKKDLIITFNGKNITPVNIESQLRETRYITEAVVFGDNRPYLVAMLTLDRNETAKLGLRTDRNRAAQPRPLLACPTAPLRTYRGWFGVVHSWRGVRALF